MEMLKDMMLVQKKQEFTLSELQNPIVYINASRTNDNIASFKVTIYDNDKVVPDTTYTAHLYKINDKAERTRKNLNLQTL